jgi:hypothetical protein
MKSFIIELSKKLCAKNCLSCGELDYAFGLYSKDNTGGYCYNCFQAVAKYSGILSLQYSLEIFKELTKSYDEFNSISDRQVVIDYIDELLLPITSLNKLPSNEKIIKFQAVLKSLDNGYFGGEKLGGAILFKKGNPSLTFDKSNFNMDKAKVLGLCAIIFVYIKNFQVNNESTF